MGDESCDSGGGGAVVFASARFRTVTSAVAVAATVDVNLPAKIRHI